MPTLRLTLDNDLLIEAGYGSLSSDQADTLLREFYDALETIVGLELASQMSPKQLDAFEAFFNTQDDEGAFAWLERNFPHYATVTRAEYEKLKEALSAAAAPLRDRS